MKLNLNCIRLVSKYRQAYRFYKLELFASQNCTVVWPDLFVTMFDPHHGRLDWLKHDCNKTWLWPILFDWLAATWSHCETLNFEWQCDSDVENLKPRLCCP